MVKLNMCVLKQKKNVLTYIAVCMLGSAPLHSIVTSALFPKVSTILSARALASLEVTRMVWSAPNFLATSNRFCAISSETSVICYLRDFKQNFQLRRLQRVPTNIQ